MRRHAGFAVATSIRQAAINDLISSAWSQGDPFFFPLPQSLTVAGTTVAFGGIARLLPPALELHPNPLDQVTAHFAFITTFTAQIGLQPARRWKVRLDASVTAQLFIAARGNMMTLMLNTTNVTIAPLQVNVLQGSTLPAKVMNALQSPALAEWATAAVHSIPIQTIQPLFPSQFSHTQPADFKSSNFSVFNWFTVNFGVSRVVLKVFEGAITAAADFAGITNGDVHQVVDLTRTHGGGSIYTHTITPYTDPKSPPILVGRSFGPNSDISISFNMGVLSHIVEHQISPQISGTPVSKNVKLNRISAGFSRFNKPLRGKEEGLHIYLNATSKGIDADVDVYLQPFLRSWDGPTNFIGSDAWLLFVGLVEIDLPWYVDLAVGVAQVLTAAVGMVVTLPALLLSPKALFPLWNDFLSDIYKGFAQADPENIATATNLTLQNAAYDAKLPRARVISVTEFGIDLSSGGGADIQLVLPQEPLDGPSLTPDSWLALDRRPIVTSVNVDSRWQGLVNNNLQAVWEVRRKDTNQVVVTGLKPYNSAGGNGVSIPHHSQELYLVNTFVVRCTLTMTLGSQVGEVWSSQYEIRIEDNMDRSHPFVEWGPKPVYFQNQGTDGKWWVRQSRSRIHRTATAARCRMVQQAASLRYDATLREQAGLPYISRYAKFRYKDSLPFAWDQLQQHRTELCEYCFFGGPEKQEPLPREDWFEIIKFPKFEKLHINLNP